MASTPWPIARIAGVVRTDPVAMADMVHSPLLPSDPSASALMGVYRLSAHQRRLVRGIRRSESDLSRGQIMSELDQRLHDAVRLRLPRDGPVAVLATGGLDSSVVAVLAREILGTAPLLVAVRGGLSSPIECFLQEKLAQALGSRLLVMDELPAFTLHPLIQLNRESDFPAGGVFSHVWDAALRIAQEAGAKTILTGEGGNELFSPGLAAAADQFREGHFIGALTTVGRSRPSDGTPVVRSLMQGFGGWTFPDLREAGSGEYVAAWQGRYASCGAQVRRRRRAQIRQLRSRGFSHTAIAAHVWLERTDLYAARSSGNGIPVRSPLAEDEPLWSCLAGMPVRLLADTASWHDKHLLRLVARRYLPSAITETRKVGVPNQIATLMRTFNHDELPRIRAGADWLGLSLTRDYARPGDLPADCGLAWTRMLAMAAWGLNAHS